MLGHWDIWRACERQIDVLGRSGLMGSVDGWMVEFTLP